MEQQSTPKPNSGLARAVMTLFSAVMACMGLYAACTQYYYGRSTRRNIEISVEGPDAIFLGLGFAVIGLMPLAFWAKTSKGAGLWSAMTLSIGVALMLAPSFINR